MLLMAQRFVFLFVFFCFVFFLWLLVFLKWVKAYLKYSTNMSPLTSPTCFLYSHLYTVLGYIFLILNQPRRHIRCNLKLSWHVQSFTVFQGSWKRIKAHPRVWPWTAKRLLGTYCRVKIDGEVIPRLRFPVRPFWQWSSLYILIRSTRLALSWWEPANRKSFRASFHWWQAWIWVKYSEMSARNRRPVLRIWQTYLFVKGIHTIRRRNIIKTQNVIHHHT